jgi:hypothetical protein
LKPKEYNKIYTKTSIFWYITQCSSLKVSRRFGRHILPPYSELNISQARNKMRSKQLVSLLLGLPFDPDDRSEILLRNVGSL